MVSGLSASSSGEPAPVGWYAGSVG